MDFASAATVPANPGATVTPAARPAAADSGHPILWAALLIWLSVETIGEALLALSSVLASLGRSRTDTPQVTPS